MTSSAPPRPAWPCGSVPPTAIPVDPGEHAFVVTDAHGAKRAARLIAREGEKQRALAISFAPAVSLAPREATPAPAPPARALPASFWILGAVGVAGLAAFSVLGLVGKGEQDEIEQACRRSCTDDRVDPMYRYYLAADVALGVGIVALGVATWVGLTHGSGRHVTQRVHVLGRGW